MNYSDKVKENFLHPKNMGEIKNPDGVGELGNPTCGDIMHVYIKVEKNKEGKEIVADVKFKTFGCAAAIATSSMITQLAKGKLLNEAKEITTNNLADELGGMPKIKLHCASMAAKALKLAIENYQDRK